MYVCDALTTHISPKNGMKCVTRIHHYLMMAWSAWLMLAITYIVQPRVCFLRNVNVLQSAKLCIKVAIIGQMNGVFISRWHLWDHSSLYYWRDGNSKSIVRNFQAAVFISTCFIFLLNLHIGYPLQWCPFNKISYFLPRLKVAWADKYHTFSIRSLPIVYQ